MNTKAVVRGKRILLFASHSIVPILDYDCSWDERWVFKGARAATSERYERSLVSIHSLQATHQTTHNHITST